jgi:hypothetical protein
MIKVTTTPNLSRNGAERNYPSATDWEITQRGGLRVLSGDACIAHYAEEYWVLAEKIEDGE